MKKCLVVILLALCSCSNQRLALSRKSLNSCITESSAKDKVINKLYKEFSALEKHVKKNAASIKTKAELSLMRTESYLKICRSSLLSCKVDRAHLKAYTERVKANIVCE